MSRARALRVAQEEYPYLPFTASLPTSGVFSCLSDALPIVSSSGQYFLSPLVQRQWMHLEEFLLHVQDGVRRYLELCLHRSPTNSVIRDALHSVSNMHTPPLPSSFPFARAYSSAKQARRSAEDARQSFALLAAAVSFVISLPCFPDIYSLDPDWTEVIPPRHDWDDFHQILGDLLATSVTQFPILLRRAGVVIDHRAPASVRYIDHYVRCNVPVYINWGDCHSGQPDFAVYEKLRRYLPPRDQILNEYRVSKIKVLHRSAALPWSHRGSGQRRGEAWPAYFERQKERHDRLAAAESETEKLERLVREESYKLFPVPSTLGTSVFRWIADPFTGFRLRTRVSRRDVPVVWRIYGRAHKKYDSIDDEWDICTEFDPAVASPLDESSHPYSPQGQGREGGDDEDFFHNLPDEGPVGSDAATAEDRIVSPIAVLEPGPPEPSLPLDDAQTPVHPTVLPPSDLSQTLYSRFGFCWPPFSPYRPTSSIEEIDLAIDLIGESNAAKPKSDERAAAADFLLALPRQNRPAVQVLGDTAGDMSNFLGVYSESPVSICLVRDSRGIARYFLRPRNATRFREDYIVSVVDAASALQAVREDWGPRPRHIAERLMERGIAFNTFLQSGHPHHLANPSPLRGLGHRPMNYAPSVRDYLAYLDASDDIVCRRYGRAALMAGGIVARIARGVYGARAGRAVRRGPSNVVDDESLAVVIDGRTYRDDALNDDDAETICGVYKVSTGTQIILPFTLRLISRVHQASGTIPPPSNRQTCRSGPSSKPGARRDIMSGIGRRTPRSFTNTVVVSSPTGSLRATDLHT